MLLMAVPQVQVQRAAMTLVRPNMLVDMLMANSDA